MSARSLAFGFIGFVAGALAVVALSGAPDFVRLAGRERPAVVAPAPPAPANEEFDAIERRMRDLRNPDWNLIQDMQPCFPGSRLCFLLRG
jgi:hypothetical protein